MHCFTVFSFWLLPFCLCLSSAPKVTSRLTGTVVRLQSPLYECLLLLAVPQVHVIAEQNRIVTGTVLQSLLFCVCEVHQCWRFIQEYGKRFAQVGRLTLDLKQDSNNKSGAENMRGGVGEIRERGRQDRNCRSSKVCAENTEFRG